MKATVAVISSSQGKRCDARFHCKNCQHDGCVAARSLRATFGAQGGLDIMTLILKPLHPVFVAEATGLDLTKPISRADACEINAAMNRYGVLVWRSRPLTAQQQIRFATAFGPLDIGLKRVFKRPERLEDERLIDISN